MADCQASVIGTIPRAFEYLSVYYEWPEGHTLREDLTFRVSSGGVFCNIVWNPLIAKYLFPESPEAQRKFQHLGDKIQKAYKQNDNVFVWTKSFVATRYIPPVASSARTLINKIGQVATLLGTTTALTHYWVANPDAAAYLRRTTVLSGFISATVAGVTTLYDMYASEVKASVSTELITELDAAFADFLPVMHTQTTVTDEESNDIDKIVDDLVNSNVQEATDFEEVVAIGRKNGVVKDRKVSAEDVKNMLRKQDEENVVTGAQVVGAWGAIGAGFLLGYATKNYVGMVSTGVLLAAFILLS